MLKCFWHLLLVGLWCCLDCTLPVQGIAPVENPKGAEAVCEADAPERVDTALHRGVEVLLNMQTGDGRREWPYDCVHKVNWQTPIGYRVASTAIAALALMQVRELSASDEDSEQRQAIERAAMFIIEAAQEPLMAPDSMALYDVRGWGYIYGLLFLLREVDTKILPCDWHSRRDEAIATFIRSILTTELPEHGGWNYDRRAALTRPALPSPFMTAATLQVLFEARERGYDVCSTVIDKALTSIQRAKRLDGSYVYSGFTDNRSSRSMPGSVGRMVIAETTLYLAGRASVSDVRCALEAFLRYWDWLETRRGAGGTHAPPYGIAPYYFFFAHYYAAQAVELLPEDERPSYRSRLNARLLSVRREDGSWNDRTFERSAAYGTAMAMMSLSMPNLPQPARWRPSTTE